MQTRGFSQILVEQRIHTKTKIVEIVIDIDIHNTIKDTTTNYHDIALEAIALKFT